jgi:hypothetical protein
MAANYDRTQEDTGNIVALEHVNTRIPDQRIATLFYVTGLGYTRDPYLMVSTNNMWINVGRSQFHLPTGEPQVLRGRTGLVTPSLDKLVRRLEAVREPLKDTRFGFTPGNDCVDVTSPWGNRFRCHAPEDRFGPFQLAIPYVELDVPKGATEGIARFYREIFDAPAEVEEVDGAPAARVAVGYHQDLVFRETAAPEPVFDGHHIQVYIGNFSRPHAKLQERGLITEESGQHQYRFQDIVDPKSGKKLFVLEHEVRSMTHPLYARPLVNRNPDVTNMAYAPGYEAAPWAMPYAG